MILFFHKNDGRWLCSSSENGEIYAPIEGEVLSVFQTKHAIGLKMTNGLEILLHMGIDTVELNGAPFTIKSERRRPSDCRYGGRNC